MVKFSAKDIPKSPFNVKVEGAAGDPSKVTAAGPGLEKTGVIVGKKTYFEVYTQRECLSTSACLSQTPPPPCLVLNG